MRKVRAASIQPRYLPLPRKYNYILDENCRDDPEEIIEQFIKPQLEVTAVLLEQAGAEGCDIVTTCEDLATSCHFQMDISENSILARLVELSEPLIESRFAGIAAKYSMYIATCYMKKIDGKIYNVGTLFDRSGKIAGEYRKTHMPADERYNCTEGDSLDVFETDFGRIGICICFDMMFAETVQILSLKGAEMIFHPTLGYGWYDSIGEATLRTRANDNSVYIVTSSWHGYNNAGKSSVIDYWGQILADAGFNENVMIFKDIDLDLKKTQPDWTNATRFSGIDDVAVRKFKERRPELYSPIAAVDHERLVVHMDQKQEIMAEYKKYAYKFREQ